MESPEYVQTSTAGAITLGLMKGRFYRGAKLRALNLLLTYRDGCTGGCAYCGLSRRRVAGDSFIRVEWPTYAVDEILERLEGREVERVCISMITHPRAYGDTLTLVERFSAEGGLPVSVLASPMLIRSPEQLDALKLAGADMCGIAVDCATPELFERLRGRGAGSGHRWEQYWRVAEWAVECFGRYNVSVHLIVGLGETEEEMLRTVQRAYDLGAEAHLFAFYPEPGSPMQEHPRVSLEQYRRVQLARYLIHTRLARVEQMSFSPSGRLLGFGVDGETLLRVVEDGRAFMTSGCRGRDGEVACNRPYGNERPGEEQLRNYPFRPEREDIEGIKRSLGMA